MKMMAGFVSKDDFRKLDDLLKQLKLKVDSHTMEIENLNDLVNSLRNITPTTTNNNNVNGVSSNDILLLRSRIEYLEG